MWEKGDRFDAVKVAELALLDTAVRRDPERVRELLHPDFVEIGRSGRRWTRGETIAALESEHERVAPEADEWLFNEVSPSVVLVTYRITAGGSISRHASFWDISGITPVMRYHQGTVVGRSMTTSHSGVDRRSLSIRDRRERDVREIVSWVPDAAALHLFSGPRLVWPLTPEQLQNMAPVGGLTASVVVSPSGDLVGHFDLTIDESVARLGRVIVKPALRGRGLASAVLDLALAEARRLGADVIRLNVVSSNEPAIRAYRRAGFTAADAIPDRPDVTVMERQLIAPSF